MSAENKAGNTIWDVIFSLNPSHFPIHRNYPKEPRGSLNPVNSQITSEICQDTVNYVQKNITDPFDLYALDFELNYTIRKLADFILYLDSNELPPYDEIYPPLEEMVKVLKDFYKWDESVLCCHDLTLAVETLAYNKDEFKNGKIDYNHYYSLKDAAKLQQAVHYALRFSPGK